MNETRHTHILRLPSRVISLTQIEHDEYVEFTLDMVESDDNGREDAPTLESWLRPIVKPFKEAGKPIVFTFAGSGDFILWTGHPKREPAPATKPTSTRRRRTR